MKTLFICAVLIYVQLSEAKEGSSVPTKNTVISRNTTVSAVPHAVTTTTRRPLLQGIRLPCSCVEGQCGCCTGYILDRFNQKACLNITYEPDDFALTSAMSINGKVMYKNTVSGKNPPPMCIRIPRLQFIRFCVEFSNIYFANRNMHLCVDAEANWEDLTLLEWSFDCFRMGAAGIAIVGPEEGGGFPATSIDAIDQTDEDYDDSARNVPLLSENQIIKMDAHKKIIFNSNLKYVQNRVPNLKFLEIKKLDSGDYYISYREPETKKK